MDANTRNLAMGWDEMGGEKKEMLINEPKPYYLSTLEEKKNEQFMNTLSYFFHSF